MFWPKKELSQVAQNQRGVISGFKHLNPSRGAGSWRAKHPHVFKTGQVVISFQGGNTCWHPSMSMVQSKPPGS